MLHMARVNTFRVNKEKFRRSLTSLYHKFLFFFRVTSSHCCASACKTNTTQNQPQQISNTQRTENKTTDVVIQQHSRRLLKMDILMSETCLAHKKWNKIASDIKLVFHSSTITMMHVPINIRWSSCICSVGVCYWLSV